VTEWYQREVASIIDVFVGIEKISCSTEHPFWVDGKGWVLAFQLKRGMHLRTRDGALLTIDEVHRRDEVTQVYNVEIDGFHTYFVSGLEILSHNMCDGTDNLAGKAADDVADANPSEVGDVFRGDSTLSSPVNSKGIGKSYLNEAGDLVPANVTGIYRGRQVTAAEHILGGFRRGAKSNSPFTSMTPNAATAASYGSDVISVNISALRQGIQSGEVTGVAILNQRQIQRLIQQNPNLSDYWKALASKWSARDGEFLIRGIVPERFIRR
jgi:hypothetical protein